MSPPQNLNLLVYGAVRNTFLLSRTFCYHYSNRLGHKMAGNSPLCVPGEKCRALCEFFQSQFHSVMGREGQASIAI